jgi:hypothetical protein
MVVALLEENPAMTAELYDRVRERLDLEREPAAGLLFHAAGPAGGSWIAYDVWETPEAWDRFRDDRLMPVVQQVFAAAGLAPPPPHRQEVFELHAMVPR